MDIFEEMKKMHEDIDRVFASAFGYTKPLIGHKHTLAKYTGSRVPITNIKETDKEVICTIELPGVQKENIQLNVTKQFIEVQAKQKIEKEIKQKGSYSYQSSSQQFYRKIPIYASILPEKANATYKDGILKIIFPKIKSITSKNKQIKIG